MLSPVDPELVSMLKLSPLIKAVTSRSRASVNVEVININ